jgi:hypothetical protein
MGMYMKRRATYDRYQFHRDFDVVKVQEFIYKSLLSLNKLAKRFL